jgi:hypothetical protein
MCNVDPIPVSRFLSAPELTPARILDSVEQVALFDEALHGLVPTQQAM